MADDVLLTLDDIDVRFGGVAALTGVSFAVTPGSIVGVIGPNGAGKSTMMNVISGLIGPKTGAVYWGPDRENLTRRSSFRRAELGIARTFQDTRLIPGMTVIDQLMCGAYARMGYGAFRGTTRTPGVSKIETVVRDEARSLLAELELEHMQYLSTDSIPSPVRRLVDFGRALMMQPRLLLLDEITAGTTDSERESVIELVLRRNKDAGVTVLSIAHDLDFIRRMADSVVVLVNGMILVQGPTEEVLARPDVLEAYIGE
jgi:branched-chain amino acid transport system ATP-binding protein